MKQKYLFIASMALVGCGSMSESNKYWIQYKDIDQSVKEVSFWSREQFHSPSDVKGTVYFLFLTFISSFHSRPLLKPVLKRCDEGHEMGVVSNYENSIHDEQGLSLRRFQWLLDRSFPVTR